MPWSDDLRPGFEELTKNPESELRLRKGFDRHKIFPEYGLDPNHTHLKEIGFGDPDNFFNLYIKELAQELDAQISKTSPNFTEPYFAGQHITGDLNASATRLSDRPGVIVLLNTGGLFLIHQITTLVGHSMHTRTNSTGKWADPRAIDSALAITVLSYLLHGHLREPERVEPIAPEFFQLTAGLLRACQKFLLAHELGHAIAGHFSEGAPTEQIGGVERIQKNWAQEFEADTLGLQILFAEAQVDGPKEVRNFLEIQACSGAFLFLQIVRTITMIHRATEHLEYIPPISNSHPSPDDRMKNLMNWLDEKITVDQFQNVRAPILILEHHSINASKYVAQLAEDLMKRGDPSSQAPQDDNG